MNLQLFKLSCIVILSLPFFTNSSQYPLLTNQLELVESAESVESIGSSGLTTVPHDDDLISLHKSLVMISSVTDDEQNVTSWLSSYLQSKNFTVQLLHVSENRFNILAYPNLQQADSHPPSNVSILLSSHIDTVPPFFPYSYNESSTLITGRGSVDDKASVAAQIIAVKRYLQANPQHTKSLALLFVVGEETGGDGAKAFTEAYMAEPKTAIIPNDPHQRSNSTPIRRFTHVVFGEPTSGALASAHKGLLMFSVHVRGRAAHSGYPWLGVSAVHVLLRACTDLLALEPVLPASSALGPSTVNVGVVAGGEATNVVAASARADVAVRLGGGEPRLVRELVLGALKWATQEAESKGGELTVEWRGEAYAPVQIDHDIPGFHVEGMNYGTDIPHFPQGQFKRYLWGPGSILVAHGANEGLKKKDLINAVDSYQKIIAYLMRNPK